jgi:hypothetical protein
VIQIYDELRDSWALAVAQVTAVFTFLIGASVWEAVGAGSAVVLVRLVAGLLFPREPWIPPLSTLTREELAVARRIARDERRDTIAEELSLTTEAVDHLERSILSKLHFRYSWEIRGWLISLGDIAMPARPSLLRRLLDSTAVRATLTAGGFIALVRALYQVWSDNCAGLLTNWPNLPCGPH